MRAGFVVMAMVAALGCGDDDSVLRDAGFSFRDAGDQGCVPYFLAELNITSQDAGMDGGLGCEPTPGTPDNECADLTWEYAGGESIQLVGCCSTGGDCGLIDPTGTLGCLSRSTFGEAATSCTPDDTDAGEDDAGAMDAGN